MKKKLLFVLLFASFYTLKAQMVAIMEVKEPIEGVCNQKGVYVILPIGSKKQVKAKSKLSEQEMEARFNALPYWKEHPEFEKKITFNLVINCKGQQVRQSFNNDENKTEDEALNQQLLEIVAGFKEWEPARIKKKKVDSSLFISIEVKNGKVKIA